MTSRRRLSVLFSVLAVAAVGVPLALASGGGTPVPTRQVATVQMFDGTDGVGLTSTVVLRCQRPVTPQRGCGVVATSRPLNLVVTRDGGRSWQVAGRAVPAPGGEKAGESAALAFTSPTAGYVAAGGALLWTDDGGAHWRRVDTAGEVESLARSDGAAWVVLRDCPAGAAPDAACPTLLAQTTGAGALGDPRTVPVTGVDMVGAPTADVAAFAETGDARSAWLVTTVDAGRTWDRRPDPCTFGGGRLVGTDARHWWLLCAQGTGMNHGDVRVYATVDGGAGWTMLAHADPQGAGTGGLTAAMPRGFAVSADGRRLWLTTFAGLQTSADGGRSWVRVPGVDLDGAGFARFDVLPPQQAWVAAANAGLWRTADGAHWTALGPTGLPGS